MRWAARWLPVLGWMTLIFVLSAQPGLRVSDDASVDAPVRAAAHVLTFGILAALLLRAVRPATGSDLRATLVAFAISTLYGVTDELHQALVPDRTGRLDDIALDAIGAALGCVAGSAVALAVSRRNGIVDTPAPSTGGERRS